MYVASWLMWGFPPFSNIFIWQFVYIATAHAHFFLNFSHREKLLSATTHTSSILYLVILVFLLLPSRTNTLTSFFTKFYIIVYIWNMYGVNAPFSPDMQYSWDLINFG